MEYCSGGELFDYIANKKKYTWVNIDSLRRKPVDSFISLSTALIIFIS